MFQTTFSVNSKMIKNLFLPSSPVRNALSSTARNVDSRHPNTPFETNFDSMVVIEQEHLNLKPLMTQLQNLNLSVPHHDFTKIVKLRESQNLNDVLEYIVQLDNLSKFKLDDVFFVWKIEGSIISVNQLEFERMCALMKAAELFGEYEVTVLKKALACAMEANKINLRKRYLTSNSFTARFLSYLKGRINVCAIEKLLEQNRSFSLTAKISQQASNYFKSSNHAEFTTYYQALALFYSSKELEAQNKYGMQIRRLEDALSVLKTSWINVDSFNELYQALIEKLNCAKKDNDLIYLQIVPSELALPEPEDIISPNISIDFLPKVDNLFSTVLPHDVLYNLKLFQDLKKEQIDPRKYHLNNLLARTRAILERNLIEGQDYQAYQKFKSVNYEDQLMRMMNQVSVSEVQNTLEKVKSLRDSISRCLDNRFDQLVVYMKKGEEIADKIDDLDNERGLVSILVKCKGFAKNLTDAMDKYFKEQWLPVLEGLEEFVVDFEIHLKDAENETCALQEEISLNLLKAVQVEEEVAELWKVVKFNVDG
eukprot:NODE_36_length_31474_cov_0.342438.p4 type:complete len:538 gc:universal NODE_36_length_31474_cov_0.342438:15624-14011(-)